MDHLPFITLAAIGLIEWVLATRFTRSYFLFGIPIFRRRAVCDSLTSIPADPNVHEPAGSSERPFDGFAFRLLDPTRLAFRERALSGGFMRLHYTPVMHGLLELGHGQLRVTGVLNWFPVAFVALFLTRVPGHRNVGVLAASLIGIVLLLYGMQAYRYSRLLRSVAKGWCAHDTSRSA